MLSASKVSIQCLYYCKFISHSGPEVFFKTCVAMKFVDDDDDDDSMSRHQKEVRVLKYHQSRKEFKHCLKVFTVHSPS